MRLLYLCYWGIEEGLTHATVFPQLSVMADMHEIDTIIFCTIERNNKKVDYQGPIHDKIEFYPLYSKGLKPSVLNKIIDFVVFPKTVLKIAQNKRIDFILSRGAPAGSLAWKVYTRTGIPFGVESFEPHADYMLESGVWKKNGLKYNTQKKWEEKQKRVARFLITVSHNYRQNLINEGIDSEKVFTIPCTVDTSAFAFSESQRQNTRKQLGIKPEDTVGIYVGKFGDIYFDHEAFEIIKTAFDYFGNRFFMIILSPNDKAFLLSRIDQLKMPHNRFFIERVPHDNVPNFLSGADFAFSFVKPSASRKYCSPIKHGEYWANGLPIIMGEGIGDDSELILANKELGHVIDDKSFNSICVFNDIKNLLNANSRSLLRKKIQFHAETSHGRYQIKDVLESIFKAS